MDFRKALREPTKEKRDELIEDEVRDEPWGDHLGPYLKNGGWPEDETITDITIVDGRHFIVVSVEISFSETFSIFCHEYQRKEEATADFLIKINRHSGHFSIQPVSTESPDDYILDTARGDYD